MKDGSSLVNPGAAPVGRASAPGRVAKGPFQAIAGAGFRQVAASRG